MSILRVESVVYGVEDLELSGRFLDDWGLEKIEGGKKGAVYTTPENQPIVVRHVDDPELPPAIEGGSTAREIIWGIDSPGELDVIASELSNDRDVTIDGDGTCHTVDESGFHIGFCVTNSTSVDVPEPSFNLHDRVGRLNRHSWPEVDAKPVPLRLGHVVLSIPSEGNWEAARFYIERLGFRVTDRMTNAGTFMQCDGSTFHHCILLYHRGDHRRWNHLAFEVADFDALMGSGNYISKKGWETTSGPGRHSLGSNWFWYFRCPLGGEIEFFTDMDRMDADWEPRTWKESPPYARWMLGDGLVST